MPAAVAVVTGVDQGIGAAIARGLRQRLPPGSVVREAATGDVRGNGAAQALAVAAASDTGGVDIVITHTTGDIVPGVRMADQVRDYISVHNHSVYRLMTAFTPVLRDGARLVVVSGDLGSLDHLPQRLRERFDGPGVDLPHLGRVMDAYVEAVESGTATEEGWPAWIEVAARVGQVAAVRALARGIASGVATGDAPGIASRNASGVVADPRLGVLVNAVAPGPDDPVEDVLRAATLPVGTREPHGQLIIGRTPVSFTRTPEHSVNA